MPDLPYTDADLRAEAARQHSGLTEDPDYMGVGEAMEDAFVPSVETDEDGSARTWGELLPYETDDSKAYNTAQRKIHDLISGAVDVSEWAVQLGVAGLTPHEPIAVRSTTGGWEVAVQVATNPGLTDAARAELLAGIREAVTAVTCRVLGLKPAE